MPLLAMVLLEMGFVSEAWVVVGSHLETVLVALAAGAETVALVAE